MFYLDNIYYSFYYNKLKPEPNILILGLDNAGKTTLLNYLTYKNNKNTKPTPGVNAKSIQCDCIKLNVYDLGGKKQLENIGNIITKRLML